MCNSNNVCFSEHTNLIPDTHLHRSELYPNQKGTLLACNFINIFRRVWLVIKDEVINADANNSERKWP